MNQRTLKIYLIVLLGNCIFFACTQAPPQNAEEIIARSFAAHGGEGLADWETLVMTGKADRYERMDRARYNANYKVYAGKPSKIRVEIDNAADKGRFFHTFFYNDGLAWNHLNLMPSSSKYMVKPNKKYLDQLYGIKFYKDNAKEYSWEEDENINDKSVFVVSALVEEDTVKLYFDKKKYFMVQEDYTLKIGPRRENVIRTYSNFTKKGSAVYPMKIEELIKIKSGRRESEQDAKYTIETIEINKDIENWMFDEDKPKPKGDKK